MGRGSDTQKAILRWDAGARELSVKLQTMTSATVYVQARDGAGNESRVFARTVDLP